MLLSLQDWQTEQMRVNFPAFKYIAAVVQKVVSGYGRGGIGIV